MLELPLSLYPSLDRIVNRVPLLHTLSLRAKSSCLTRIEEFDAFRNAPRLKKLALWGNWSSVRNLHFPWEQMSSYADEDGSATNPHNLLSMSNVVNLTYRPKRAGFIHFKGELKRLRSIRILSGLHTGAFLDNVVMPSLEEITLDDMCLRYDIKTIADILESLVTRSRCSIRVLNIDNVAFGDTPYVMRLFRCMPDLSSLNIRHWASRELSKLFCELKQDQGVLPKLRSISLQSNLTTAVGDLVDMVEARWHGEMDSLQSVACPSSLERSGVDLFFDN